LHLRYESAGLDRRFTNMTKEFVKGFRSITKEFVNARSSTRKSG
jgi:hypothetical protein